MSVLLVPDLLVVLIYTNLLITGDPNPLFWRQAKVQNVNIFWFLYNFI